MQVPVMGQEQHPSSAMRMPFDLSAQTSDETVFTPFDWSLINWGM